MVHKPADSLLSVRSVLRAGSLLATILWLGACEQARKPEQTAGVAGAASSQTSTDSLPHMPTTASFGKTQEGTEVQLYTLTNAHGLQATITNYGGIVTSLLVPDKAGKLGDIVLGFDNVSGYQSPEYKKAGPYFGALIGRYGNRIKAGKFTLDGQGYTLAKNNGPNHLHGGLKGFDKVLWQAEPGRSTQGQTLKLTYTSPDGEEGYPGNLTVTATYTLTTTDELRIDYAASTDKATPVNLTNHSYFNLSPGQSQDVLKHEVRLGADRYTVVDKDLIPTGELRAVRGTPFDFTAPHAIGERIAQVPGGYDHNWVLLGGGGGLRSVAMVHDPASGRALEVLTDQPGIQFYTGNFLDGSLRGKAGQVYGKHAGFCLETQHFPDSPNQPKFPTTTLQPGQTLQSTTVYKFSIKPANDEA